MIIAIRMIMMRLLMMMAVMMMMVMVLLNLAFSATHTKQTEHVATYHPLKSALINIAVICDSNGIYAA